MCVSRRLHVPRHTHNICRADDTLSAVLPLFCLTRFHISARRNSIWNSNECAKVHKFLLIYDQTKSSRTTAAAKCNSLSLCRPLLGMKSNCFSLLWVCVCIHSLGVFSRLEETRWIIVPLLNQSNGLALEPERPRAKIIESKNIWAAKAGCHYSFLWKAVSLFFASEESFSHESL